MRIFYVVIISYIIQKMIMNIAKVVLVIHLIFQQIVTCVVYLTQHVVIVMEIVIL